MIRSAGHLTGVGTTLLIHALLVAVVVVKYDVGCSNEVTRAPLEDAIVIEAALSFRKAPKKRQPQKQKKTKFAPPEAPKVARDDTKPPDPPPEKKEALEPDADEIDIKSVLRKNRRQDEDLGETGVEEVDRGSSSGSEWGTEREAKGDEYVGELRGRVEKGWNHPSLDKVGGSTLGCVKLDERGKIVDREVRRKSPNDTLNRSVYLALKDAPDMTKPVPDHLVELLTVRGICFNFTPPEM